MAPPGSAPALGVGLVGCGRWGRLILRDLVALGARVSVIASGENARHAAAAGATSVANGIGKLPIVDGIVVATPTSTHADVIEALLPRGVPIFCEKPLCQDAVRARRLAAAGSGRVFVMDKWRYHRGVLALRDIARSGELGQVVGLRSARLGWGHDYADVDCVWTLMPHELAIALEILGRLPRPLSAVADRVDGAVMGLTAVSAIEGGPWHVCEVGIRSPERRRSVTLLCRDGSAELADAHAGHITVTNAPPANGSAPDPQVIRRPIAAEMPLLAELAAFLDHLKGGPAPKSSVDEATQIVTCLAEIRGLAGI
ncbi:MAG: Gfo/Idh/MocA family protein [Rhodospirillales bacterium]